MRAKQTLSTLILAKVFKCEALQNYPKSHYRTVVHTDADVFWTDEAGKRRILFKIRKGVIPHALLDAADAVLRSPSRMHTRNRMVLHNANHSVMDVQHSCLSGYYDKCDRSEQHLFPTQTVCRPTAFTKNFPDRFAQAVPLFRAIDRVYARLAPRHHRMQHAFIDAIPAQLSIDDTVFTTVTTNYNWSTACHRDSGNFDGGLGNLTIGGDERWSGCLLGFPEFRVAVNVRKGDCIIMDAHQFHCNTPLKLREGGGCRLSFVCYARQNMALCTKSKVVNGVKHWYKQ